LYKRPIYEEVEPKGRPVNVISGLIAAVEA